MEFWTFQSKKQGPNTGMISSDRKKTKPKQERMYI